MDEEAQEKPPSQQKCPLEMESLTSAPAKFERQMGRVLKGLQRKTLLLYLNDVIVFSLDFESHLERLAM